MKDTYLIKAIVNATPMTRGEYNKQRGWLLPADEYGKDSGYLVEYVISAPPGDAPYITWVAADQFDKMALKVNISQHKPEPWWVRLIAERSELLDRLTKLQYFIRSIDSGDIPAQGKLTAVDISLLKEQSRLMRATLNVLDRRINLILDKEDN
mgnify:CR=1 FL=1